MLLRISDLVFVDTAAIFSACSNKRAYCSPLRNLQALNGACFARGRKYSSTSLVISTPSASAENVAEKFGISREDQDRFAFLSQQKAEHAIRSNQFKEEIVAVPIPQGRGGSSVFDTDEHPRFGTTLEALSQLKPAFKKNGTITAGNASGLTIAAVEESITCTATYTVKAADVTAGSVTNTATASVAAYGASPSVTSNTAQVTISYSPTLVFLADFRPLGQKNVSAVAHF
jgi:hypothetical protein